MVSRAQHRHRTRSAGPVAVAALLLALVAVTGCTARARTTGKAPEGRVRTLKEGLDEQATRDTRTTAPVNAVPRGQNVPEENRVEGVAATKTYHRPDCTLLEDVPVSGRIPFTSVWDGLDGGHSPCRVCDPGP